MKNYLPFLSKLLSVNMCEWQIAIRKVTSDGMLYEGNLSEFTLIPNSQRYWYADPFLFAYKDKEYVFVEMYDRKLKKGNIGYAEIRRGRKLKFKKCLELPYHLSYPCIYEQDGNIYMIPECYQSGRIVRYKCVRFPDKWIEDITILNKIAVDTTPYEINGNIGYFSTFFESMNNQVNNNLFLIDRGSIQCLKKSDYTARSAGLVFTRNNKTIRPHQDCEGGYGRRLIFSQIDVLTNEEYKESEIYCVSAPDDVDNSINRIKIKNRGNHKYKGVHTYNASDKYEVIDLKYYDGRSVYDFIRNLKNYLKYKLKSNANQ